MTEVAQQVINALSVGGIYALLALGLAVVFSVLGLVNFAHGEILTLSGYAMLALGALGVPFFLVAVAALLVGMLVAAAMERIAFRPVRGASEETMLLTSFGVSIVIQALIATVVSPRPRAVPVPGWVTGTITLGSLNVQVLDLLAIGLTALALAGVVLLLRRTTIGIAMRAAAEDFDAARLMGVRANATIVAAFVLSGLLAGLTAILVVGQRGAVTPTMGLVPVLYAFVANVVGGIGNVKGAVLGGFLLGAIDTALRATLPGDLVGFTEAFLFTGVALILLLRPGGLFASDQGVRV